MTERIYTLRMAPKDIGVAAITALCLLAGLALMLATTTRTTIFQDELSPLRLAYPADWLSVDSLQAVSLRVVDPTTPGTFKTTLTLEQRELDPADPPTLQTLLDRRVEERQTLEGYHFLDEAETTVDGERALASDYAYVAQPIDGARRAALPVVVRAREYIVIAGAQSYYLTLAAPADQFERAEADLERIVASTEVEP